MPEGAPPSTASPRANLPISSSASATSKATSSTSITPAIAATIQKLVALKQTHPEPQSYPLPRRLGRLQDLPRRLRHQKRPNRICPFRQTTDQLFPHRRHRPRLGIPRPGQCTRLSLLPRGQRPFHRAHPPAPERTWQRKRDQLSRPVAIPIISKLPSTGKMWPPSSTISTL